MMKFYIFQVKAYSDYDAKEYYARGIVPAGDYSDAVERIARRYETVIDLFIREMEDTDIIDLDADYFGEIMNNIDNGEMGPMYRDSHDDFDECKETN